ncbi:MAG: FAD-binding oxidoreductase [Chroococcus sp. CMT-3BRIN-NPC107]|jgi:glycine/D-amino acid oxidase-like deaminating enzyme|nr:FAD-binding oxidoreductase [Chroococcus sp. CMT-3BRIN-NPC107]
MSHIVIIGCGVIGATIAYELSLIPGLKITVLDKQLPAQGSTAAALGVLMGIISHKIKGKAWQMRSHSIERYKTLIPELEATCGRTIPHNQQGILKLCQKGEDLAKWENLAKIRSQQGWKLEVWDRAKLQANCPQIDCQNIPAAVYSPQDIQVDPVVLTLALVEAAKNRGVNFHFDITALQYELTNTVKSVQTDSLQLKVDWLVVAAGLGSLQAMPVSDRILNAPKLDLRPVLGQALQVSLPNLGNPDFQPVITGNDVHIVPCLTKIPVTDYWIGATVEFPLESGIVALKAEKLEEVRHNAIAFCPALATSNIIKTWSGLRPRPENRPAPIIEPLEGFSNVLLATGHYRNGVLLAPATAQRIIKLLDGFLVS